MNKSKKHKHQSNVTHSGNENTSPETTTTGVKYRSGIRLSVLQWSMLPYFLFVMEMLCMNLPEKAKAIYGAKGYYGIWILFTLATWFKLGNGHLGQIRRKQNKV
jgi:hypothetical protein